jgi:putative ABC transport system permease protein
MLTIGAIVMSRQVKLLLNKRLGANEFNIVSIDNQPVQIKNNYLSFKSDLLSSPLIHDVTSGMEVPGSEIMDRMEFTTTGIVDDFKNKMPYVFPADANYFSFFNIPIIAGQSFPPYNGNDSLPELYIVNESALKLWGWTAEEALGKPFSLIFKIDENKNLFNGGRIIGVVKDFQLSSSRNKVQPMVYFQKSCWMFNSQIKIDTAQKNEALNFIRQTWKKYYADYECDIRFVDDLYNALYYKEIQQQKLVSLFTFLAIFISCLGLWSISNVISKKRTKEIGIRKANGAKTIEIVMLLNKEFLTLVAAAIFIAIPLSYFLLQMWLQSYAYQVPLHWDAFLIASILAILTSVLTVSWQSWNVAVKNPVESLRYE